MAGQQDYLPSFRGGFARAATESEHPGLWQGLIAAWMPELGQTGRVLIDLAGQRLNGGLTGATWGIDSSGRYVSFSGTMQYVSLPQRLPFSTNVYSYCLRMRPTVGGTVQRGIISDRYAAGADHGRLLLYTGSAANVTICHGASSLSSTAAISLNAWHQVTVTFDGTSAAIWIDGKLNTAGMLAAKSPQVGLTPYLGTTSTLLGAFAGAIGSVLFYTRVLLAQEIRQLSMDPPAPFRLRRPNGAATLRRSSAAYRRVLASAYGVSP